mgnify:CR=1 FL=1
MKVTIKVNVWEPRGRKMSLAQTTLYDRDHATVTLHLGPLYMVARHQHELFTELAAQGVDHELAHLFDELVTLNAKWYWANRRTSERLAERFRKAGVWARR